MTSLLREGVLFPQVTWPVHPMRWGGPCAGFEEPGRVREQALQRAGQSQAGDFIPEFSGS